MGFPHTPPRHPRRFGLCSSLMQSAPTPTTPSLSSQTLDALAEVITGGSGFGTKPSIGKYRSGWNLEKFFQTAGHAFILSGRSRVPAVREYLAEVLAGWNGRGKVIGLIERVADPRDYILEPDALQATITYLNRFLEFDDLELVRERQGNSSPQAQGSRAGRSGLRR